jgi:hypothetical protein
MSYKHINLITKILVTPLHTEVSADAVRGVEQLRLMRLYPINMVSIK